MSLRYTLGPAFGQPVTIVADPAPVLKPVVAVTIAAVDEAAKTVTVTVPAYDPAAFAKLSEIRVYLVQPDPANPTPTDAPGYTASQLPFTPADVTSVDPKSGGNVSIPFPAVAPGAYLGQVVLGSDDSVPAAPAPAPAPAS